MWFCHLFSLSNWPQLTSRLFSVLPLLVDQRFAFPAVSEVFLCSFGIDVLGSASGSVVADVA